MRSLLALFCILFSYNSFASHASSVLRDSVGVENSNGTQVIIHKVAPRESYYSIGRIYNVPPKEIIELNGNKVLQIGTLIKVPTRRPFIAAGTSSANSPASSATADILTYKVGPKETLFAIARRFNTTVESIKELNNLQNNNLSVGQMLKVRQGSQPAPEPIRAVVAVKPTENTEEVEEEKTAPKIQANRLGLIERNERGVAVWIEDENLDKTKMLALHKTAPVGTIVKITNPMTDRSTFAKVVGKFAENETTRDAIIVITKAAADVVGALDKRFQVSIDYGVPNE